MNIGEKKFDTLNKSKLSLADKFIRSKLSKCIQDMHDSINAYRFDQVANTLYEFI